MRVKKGGSHSRIYAVVARIPRGRVATYGQVASLARMPGQARLVGYALSALSEATLIPWHRVINAKGRVSPRSGGSAYDISQKILLQSEGVRFGPSGAVKLREFRWEPRARGGR